MGKASHYTDTILQAIDIISTSKVKKAGYDKTVKAEVKKCLDKATGKYLISYEGIEQIAYSTSPDLKYETGDGVYVLIPSNNTQRVKTIINTIDHIATTSDGEKDVEDLYNEIGPNLLSSNININLQSYIDNQEIILYEENQINVLIDEYEKYLSRSDGIVLKANLHTKLPAEQQISGSYGISVVCLFKSNASDTETVERTYTLSIRDVYGFPYSVIEKQNIQHLEVFDGENFLKIVKIYAYSKGFPYSKLNQEDDIFFENFSIQGAGILDSSSSTGYSLFINYSENGDTIEKDKADKILLKAELKLKGQVISDNVEYYWFKENGTVFQGNSKYCSYGKQGWECLNKKQTVDNGSFIGATDNRFIFYGTKTIDDKDTERGKILFYPLEEKKINIKCVAIYGGKKKIDGKGVVFNNNITKDFIIQTSDNPSVDYYFGNGSPTLTCVFKEDGIVQEFDDSYKFDWSMELKDGNHIVKQTAAEVITAYKSAKQAYENYETDLVLVAENDKSKFNNKNKNVINTWLALEGSQIIDKNIYNNVNVKSIKDQAKIICGISQKASNADDAQYLYLGTASITLYNHMEVKGEYSLNILNGTQVFQYDPDGISPCSEVKENPYEIKQLQLILLDNEGRQINYEEIIGNGKVYWCIPNTNTLLIDNNENPIPKQNYALNGTVKALAANDSYTVYQDKQFFSYFIADTFDYNKTNNNIRLYIIYKDMIFDIYTDFTFPKSGDPGTNGTKYYAKILPGFINDEGQFKQLSTERVYIDNLEHAYDNQGRQVTKFKGVLYNGSVDTNNDADFWSCPIKTANSKQDVSNEISDEIETEKSSHFCFNKDGSLLQLERVKSKEGFQIDERLDILRAQFGTGQNIKYFAQLPICYVYTSKDGSNYDNANYRVKVREKTGYSYVVYAEDGTHPDYGSNPTFEIILEKLQDGYYIEQPSVNYKWYWTIKGNLVDTVPKPEEGQNRESLGNIYSVLPQDKFAGDDLTSKIIVEIYEQDSPIATIYIPIYMIINRYGHSNINDWDGNSIQLGDDDKGYILAPQVGAGKKDKENNQFTGIIMGEVITPSTSKDEVGLFGYNKGQRTIFLDAETGKAEFGKNGSGKIIINPNKQIKQKDAALLYSNNFDVEKYIVNDGAIEDSSGYIKYQITPNEGGMIIDLTTPQIAFANGLFSVDGSGKMHAASGDIGGWQITETQLHKNNETGMASSGKDTPLHSPNSIFEGDTIAFWSGGNPASTNATSLDTAKFYATHKGYLHSEAGDIGGWNITTASLSKGDNDGTHNYGVGMSADNASSVNKAFFANGDKFYVTHGGYLKSQSGQIANWNIGPSALTDGRVGLGSTTNPSLNPFGGSVPTFNIWGLNSSNELNFALTNEGRLFSKHGTIGGWNISSDSLASTYKEKDNNNVDVVKGSISMKSNGVITGTDGTNQWTINGKGYASFNNIDASGGTIGSWTINNNAIKNNHTTLTSDGQIKTVQGSIGGIEIYDGGIKSGQKWQITSDGDAMFKNLHGNIASTGSLVGNGMTMGGGSGVGGVASYLDPNSVTASTGGKTLHTYMEDLVSASTGQFGTLINNYTFNYQNHIVKWSDISVVTGITPVKNLNGYVTGIKVSKTVYHVLTAGIGSDDQDL